MDAGPGPKLKAAGLSEAEGRERAFSWKAN